MIQLGAINVELVHQMAIIDIVRDVTSLPGPDHIRGSNRNDGCIIGFQWLVLI